MDVAAISVAAARPVRMTATLRSVGQSHTLRADARQWEHRFVEYDNWIQSVHHFYLGDVLPERFRKGILPDYLHNPDEPGVPVINTLSIQALRINVADCRLITNEAFEAISIEQRPRADDVLLTTDGGVSIGKPVLFSFEGEFAHDSHVAILRPSGISPAALLYLLASPFGQVQFQRAESGASGQTAVTEDDIRRFRFPLLAADELAVLVNEVNGTLAEVDAEIRIIEGRRSHAWSSFAEGLQHDAHLVPPVAD